MKLEIQRKEIDNVIKDFNLLKNVKGKNFAQKMIETEVVIKEVIDSVKAMQVPPDTEEVKAYQTEINSVYEKNLHKDADGKILYDGDKRPRIKDEKLFQQSLEKLALKHPVAMKQISEHEIKYQSFVLEDIEIEFPEISEKDIPESVNMEELLAIRRYWKKKELLK